LGLVKTYSFCIFPHLIFLTENQPRTKRTNHTQYRYHLLKTKSNEKITITIILISISILILSCGANPTKLMAKTMDKVYIGMPISEFKEKIEKEELVEMNEKVTIFRKVIKTYNDTPGIGWRRDHRYFYFENNKLVKVDKGERAVDYRIKVD
jgi:hypothetical protein